MNHLRNRSSSRNSSRTRVEGPGEEDGPEWRDIYSAWDDMDPMPSIWLLGLPGVVVLGVNLGVALFRVWPLLTFKITCKGK